MKKILQSISLLLAGIALQAQPVISTWTPPFGLTIIQHTANAAPAPPPPPGNPMQSWDFSGFTSAAQEVLTIVEPSSLPNNSDFPNATFAFSSSQTTSFIRFESNDYLFLGGTSGEGASAAQVDQNDSPLILLRVPSTYNQNFSHTSRMVLTTSSYVIRRKIESESTADGYGTLITPAGTFDDALRITTTKTIYDTLQLSGLPLPPPPNVTVFTSVENAWFSPSHPGRILAIINETNIGGNISRTFNYTEAEPISTNNLNETLVGIFPNPSHGLTNIQSQSTMMNGGIYDLNGRLIKDLTQEIAGNTLAAISTSSLPTGMYIVRLQTQNGLSAKKLIIQ